ncbi:hypothetical protein HK098_004251 [Nowakowskiella sp. JEL0407]|nr:hypothetical protein HK098_004251 [Nowakowskiella sp. JEL0407]
MSLFEEFENAESAPNYSIVSKLQNNTSQPVLLEPGYVSTSLTTSQQLNILTLDRVQFTFPGTITSLVSGSNIVVVALEGAPVVQANAVVKSQRVMRIDVGQPDAFEEIEIPYKQKKDRIRKLFIDPTGTHLIISSDLGENYYLHAKWKKCRLLNRFKGILISAVAWGKSKGGAGDLSGIFLVGSLQGHIFEVELQATDDLFKREERYFRQVYTIGDDLPILGLRYEKFPAHSRKHVVFITTPERLYQLVGLCSDPNSEYGMFGDFFRMYDVHPGYQEIPGKIENSELHFWSQYLEGGYPSIPKDFAWLTEPGIYYGSLSFGNQNAGDNVVENAQLLPYPPSKQQATTVGDGIIGVNVPISIALTQFHFILLFSDRVKGINALSGEVVYEEEIPLKLGEKVVGMSCDAVKSTYWVYTTETLFELLVTDEDRDMWKLYLDRKSFDIALSFAKNEAQRDKILTTQAEYYFSQGRYILSASYYAQSVSLSFEDIVLKFISKNEREALKEFLVKRLEKLKKVNVIQTILICTWLVEIYIQKLNTVKDEVDSASAQVEAAKLSSDILEEEMQDKIAKLRRLKEEEGFAKDEFRGFLETYKDRLDRETTYLLISSHGRTEEMLYFAELIGDFEKVVDFYINEHKWTEALSIISKQNNLELYYKFSPTLMENASVDTVNAWIKQPSLNPRSLIPALLKYKISNQSAADEKNQAIRYLQYACNKLGNQDPLIHNYLLSLYVAVSTPENEDELLRFLSEEKDDPHFDLQYALRLCSQRGLMQSSVQIYSAMGLYEQAVKLALKHNDLELARINADKPDDDEPLRKKLWLSIARHVVEEKKDIKQAMEFLKFSNDLLKIEDVLPFFPDFVLINDFKQEICAALEEYNLHIEELKTEMDEATTSAESIRLDIRELRNKYATISVLEKCRICALPLLTRQFFVFPCQHVFHADCLINQVIRDSNPRQARKITELQSQITKELSIWKGNPAEVKGDDPFSKEKPKHEILKEELDELVAGECVLCGDTIIKMIEKPFIMHDETEIVQSWII